MIDAEVRELSEAFRLMRREGSLSAYTCDRVIAVAQDYLRLKAAVRIQHNPDVTAKSQELAEAQLLLKQVAKEPPCQ